MRKRQVFIAAAIFSSRSLSLAFNSSPHNFQYQQFYHSRALSKMSYSPDFKNIGEEKTYIDKLALILLNSNNKQLVARSHGKSVFFTPGGKREPNETDEQALIRECKEELSVCLTSFSMNPVGIEFYGTFEAQAFGKAPGTMVRMTCFRVTPRDAEIELEKLVKASDEVEELNWIDSTFEREKLTITGIMILEDLKEKGLID
ncbi:hypothetical protein ACHAXS_007378 [Conticribra weissflogii]